jgi:hypothetical protein
MLVQKFPSMGKKFIIYVPELMKTGISFCAPSKPTGTEERSIQMALARKD